jgi:minor extracellular serine protease Vpr
MNKLLRITALILFVSLLAPLGAVAQADIDKTRPAMPDVTITQEPTTQRGSDPLDKMSPELRSLFLQFAPTRGGRGGVDETGVRGYTAGQLQDLFGISASTTNPIVTVSFRLTDPKAVDDIKRAGGTVVAKTGETVYVAIALQELGDLARIATVSSIGVLKSAYRPSPPKDTPPPSISIVRGGPAGQEKPALASQFNKQGLTGKGAIVGVIDSGIDWRHDDFIRPDGTSRILAIWDLSDNSYQETNGKVGTKPPVYLEKQQAWLGTLYTNKQINDALKGHGTINSYDRFGHGTAVAGTAAGNGRATGNGVPDATYTGVAPEADLIVVKAMDCDFFFPMAALTAEWIGQYAQSLGRPVVTNMSFGSQFGAHDGSGEEEQFIDSYFGPGKPGRAITISAGNDGRYSLHGGAKFGPKVKGQEDNFSEPVELTVKDATRVMGVFDMKDDWGLALKSTNPIFRAADGKQAPIYIVRNRGTIEVTSGAPLANKDAFDQFRAGVSVTLAAQGSATDLLQLQMPVGTYLIWGFGTTATVSNGNFDLYGVEPAYLNKAVFGMGTRKSEMVGAPGTAKNAITVGSYDFLTKWENVLGETASYNLTVGGPSSYTSPGPRRDGVVKPDISAPAKFTISSFSQFSKVENGGCTESMATGAEKSITRDGRHIAWEGTSAASPFTAGVVALMLQKNPGLDNEQIKQILIKTARKGGLVGAVPNGVWGWGMIDPAAAIAATPAPGPKKKPVK